MNPIQRSPSNMKRLRKEHSSLRLSKDPDIYLRPQEDNICRWNAYIKGPSETPYAGGVFHMRIDVMEGYPMNPPSIIFVTKVFHPNVNFSTGEICLDILKKEWSPAWNLEAACRAIILLLSNPDVDSPWNCDAGNMLRAGDQMAFHSMAHLYTIEHATNEIPCTDAERRGKSKDPASSGCFMS